MVIKNYEKSGLIYEKYDGITLASQARYIGYKENVVGFGWTNATYLYFDKLSDTIMSKREK